MRVGVNCATLLSLAAAVFLPVCRPVWGAEKSNIRQEERIIMVIRYDDYSSRTRLGMDLKFIEALRRHHIRCTFGVIPFISAGDAHDTSSQETIPLHQVKIEALKSVVESGLAEVALHGCSHQNVLPGGHPWWSDFLGVGYSEFFGLDYRSQREKIEKGLSFLKERLETEITTFIPPWNSFDKTTLRVLEDLGFNCFSGGIRGHAPENSGLYFLPATCSILQVRETVERIRRKKIKRALIVVMLHEAEFIAPGSTLGFFTPEELDNSLDWLAAQEDITFKSIDQLASLGEELSPRRFNYYNSYGKSLLFAPPIVDTTTIPRHYPAAEISSKLRFRYWAFVFLYYPAVLLLFFIIALPCWTRLFAWSASSKRVVKYAGPPAFVILLSVVLLALPMGCPSATAAAVLAGISAGAFGAIVHLRRKMA